jgi:hypothetical protein
MRSPWCWPLRPRGTRPRSCSVSSLRPCRPPRTPSRLRRSSAACTPPRAHCTETNQHFIKHLAGIRHRSTHAHKTKTRASRVPDQTTLTDTKRDTDTEGAPTDLTPAPTTATDRAGAASDPAMASTERRLVRLARAEAGR